MKNLFLRLNKRILWGLCIAAAVFTKCNTADAAEIDSYPDSVVQIKYIVSDKDGNSQVLKEGQGVCIGLEDGAVSTVITNRDLVTCEGEELAQVVEMYTDPLAEEQQDPSLTFSIEVLVDNDITVDATLKTESESYNLAVLGLSQTIYKDTVYQFDMDDDVIPNDQVYAVSYNKVVDGKFLEQLPIQNITYNKHDVDVTEDMVGGALLNSNGELIGLIQDKTVSGYFCALDVEEISAVLKMMGISYSVAEHVVVEPTIWEKLGVRNLVLIGVGLALTVALIIFLIVRKIKKNKARKQADEFARIQANTMPENDGPYMPKNSFELTDKDKLFEKIAQEARTRKTEETKPEPSADLKGFAHMSSSAEDDDVQKEGALLRIEKTQIEMVISKKATVIGKSMEKADIVIQNSNVSRTHARIIWENDKFYLVDLKSTNGTYLNNKKLVPQQLYELKSEDIIKCADEKMTFKRI